MIDLDKIQEQLDNGWPVEADDIQALVDIVREIDTAILWRQEDLRLKRPTVDEASE